MYESFESLPEDRRKKIIDICIEEFAKNGYEKASTNAVVKEAGISKGILFHYFGSKKNLYLYVLDYITEYGINRFNALNEQPAPDIFDRLVQRQQIKMKIALEEPNTYKILADAFLNVPDDLKAEIQKRYDKAMAEQAPKTFEHIDVSKFRKGVDPQKALELIRVCMEGLFQKYMHLYKSAGGWTEERMQHAVEEAFVYIEMIKNGIYA